MHLVPKKKQGPIVVNKQHIFVTTVQMVTVTAMVFVVARIIPITLKSRTSICNTFSFRISRLGVPEHNRSTLQVQLQRVMDSRNLGSCGDGLHQASLTNCKLLSPSASLLVPRVCRGYT